jgi:hypothetical protein
MTKTEAIDLLGGTASSAAAAVGVTISAVSQWPDLLPERIEQRVIGAAFKAGFLKLAATAPDHKEAA